MPVAKPTNSTLKGVTIFGSAIGAIALATIQAVLFWWVSDQTATVRAQGRDLLKLESNIESYKTAQAATAAAMQPFANADRLTLNRVDKAIDEQTNKLDYTVKLVQDMNKVLQELGASQIALRNNFDRLEDRVIGRNNKGRP